MTERLVTLIIILLLTGIVWLSDNLNRGYTLWVAIAGMFLGYFTYVWAISWKVRVRQTPHAPHFRPFVTVVIPAKNEEKVIAQTVREMAKLVYHNTDGCPNYELMVVDDGSTDRTLEVLEALKDEYPQLRVHHRSPRPKSSKAAVLNEIMPLSRGAIFAVFDADARILPNFLDRIIPYLADPQVGAVQARKQISNPDVNWLTGAQEDELMMLMDLEQSRDLVEGAVELRGNGMLVKREALEEVGGWNDQALTEDLDMSTRLLLKGWDVRYCPDIAVMEEAVPTWGALFKQRRRWVEGGLRRYAKYFFRLMAPQVPLAKRIDMLVFFCQFAIPIWLMIDVAFIASDVIVGKGFHMSTLMWMLLVMLIVTSVSVANGIRKVVTRNPWLVLARTVRHEFFALHWFPVIFVTVFHILFARKPMEWTKTEHHGEAELGRLKPRYSPTKLATYQRCPRQYQFQYVHRIPRAPTAAMAFGATLHRVLERPGQTPQETAQRLESAWTHLGPADAQWRQEAEAIVAAFHQVEDEGLPILTEKRLLAPYEGVTFWGIVDRVDRLPSGGLEIIDYKSTSRIVDEPDRLPAETWLQLTLYHHLVTAHVPSPVERWSVHYLRNHHRLSFLPGPSDIDRRLAEAAGIARAIEADRSFGPLVGDHCGACPLSQTLSGRKKLSRQLLGACRSIAIGKPLSENLVPRGGPAGGGNGRS